MTETKDFGVFRMGYHTFIASPAEQPIQRTPLAKV
jgi:hypothetical protein